MNGVTDELKGQTQTLIWHIMATWDEKMEAAKKVRDVLGRIHEFYQKRFPDFMDFYKWAEDIDIRSLSVYEIKLRQELKIRPKAWNAATDWTYNAPVPVYPKYILVSSQSDMWSKFQALDSLIKWQVGSSRVIKRDFQYKFKETRR
jgi:hypothetical protein